MLRDRIDLDGKQLEASNGVWAIEYIGEPKASNGDPIEYYLRLTWRDPKNPDNRIVPERRLRLTVYTSDALNIGFRERLIQHLAEWAGFIGDSTATFTYNQGIKERATPISN
jgi:hypothetical protein